MTEPREKHGLVMMARKRDMRELREPNAPFFVPMYKETLLAANDLPSTLPSVVLDLLQEYEDVFPKEVPPGLPPKRGIEHQIVLVPAPHYRTDHRTEQTPRRRRKFSSK